MFKRKIESIVKRFAEIYPIIGITGPRQSGKTTVATELFPHLPYVSFEDLGVRLQAENDPHGFLEKYVSGAIFDEVQECPSILSYLQGVVDKSPAVGRFIITGSQNFALSECVSQSLAGRVGMITLLPLSLNEIGFNGSIMYDLFYGGYPRLRAMNMKPGEFYPSYVQTYLERDVRQIKNIEDMGKFQMFLKLCAGRVGQLVNVSSLAQDCGISHTTASQWLTVLGASYILFLVQPYHQNFNKRMIKSPKLYFYDTGLVCHLLALESSEQLETHYLKGALYENAVILELVKGRLNKGQQPFVYFWRDKTGHEIDCIGEWGGVLRAIEIKMNSSFQIDQVKNLKFFGELAPMAERYLISQNKQEGSFLGTKLLPFDQINRLLD